MTRMIIVSSVSEKNPTKLLSNDLEAARGMHHVEGRISSKYLYFIRDTIY
jgi:hypothetical protein